MKNVIIGKGIVAYDHLDSTKRKKLLKRDMKLRDIVREEISNVFVLSIKKSYPSFLFPGKSQFYKSKNKINRNLNNIWKSMGSGTPTILNLKINKKKQNNCV